MIGHLAVAAHKTLLGLHHILYSVNEAQMTELEISARSKIRVKLTHSLTAPGGYTRVIDYHAIYGC